MTDKTLSARILAPAGRLRDRLAVRRAWLGARGAAGMNLPEPMYLGEADRGSRLVGDVWAVAGREIALAGRPIWDAVGLDPRIEPARQGFGWLDDLAALGNRPARTLAQGWTQDWIRRFGGGAGPGWEPELAGARAMRWVAHARLLVEGADRPAEAAFWRALGAHQRYLARAWPRAAAGLPRLRALAGLVWTGRALPDAGARAAVERMGELAEAMVGREGELAARSPEELARVLALLTWTARLLEDGGSGASAAHLGAIVRLVPTLRPLRMGDGTVARFHGGGGWDAIAIDKALAELRLETQPRPRLPMGFARLTGGRIVLVMDGAAPPGGAAAATAHAGTLGFEMSVGRQPLVTGQGPGGAFGPPAALASRQTRAHSTVEVDGASSAGFAGGALVAGPTLVSVRLAQDATGMWLLATHDGYVAGKGLLHERRIFVDARGGEARGEEILTVTDARARETYDRAARAAGGRLGFATRFHLHPDVAVVEDDPQAPLLKLPGGEAWEFRAGGGEVAVEESVWHDPAAAAPRRTRQVVVRSEVVEYLGQVTWSFLRVLDAPRAVRAEPR
ncbi:heparinase II/III family protein [Amaricoccus sp.]|uniref:heparinase II/III family protein n=1 Tax=Amaricoccus sp. TaxID=1872485 RepID=UPI001B6C7157|nr:heparinase II/III family protein [Amaricoccus sp.]MBP7001172.1 heparinase II/III family protein [Amaricoccus sp.]